MTAWTRLKRALPAPLRASLRSLHARSRASTAQVGQDFWVFGEVFDGQRNGFFVDVGSADGMALSNTFLLEKRYGWRGICIDANPRTFERLRQVRSALCLNVCVDAEEGEVDFVLREQLSGIVAAGAYAPGVEGDEVVRVPTRRLDAMLREHDAPPVIDYLSIDIEGFEGRVLGDFPFDVYCFRCLTIERPDATLRSVLEEKGYRMVRQIPGLDAFFVHESFEETYQRNAFAFWKRFRGRRVGFS
jgi:FkbM family methyltransferase